MKVLIAIPCGSNVPYQFAESLANLSKAGIHTITIFRESSCLVDSRNSLVEDAIRLKCSHILFLDSDMVIPDTTLLVLAKAGEDIIGCNYVTRRGLISPTALRNGFAPQMFNEALPISRVEKLGFGCILIKLKVFATLPRPWFTFKWLDEGYHMSEDYYFCQQALSHGYKIYCHNDISRYIGHVGQKTFIHIDYKLRT